MKDIFSAIIEWHKINRRSMPWRDDPTPYHVWLSEIMLQQTRIEAVIPYYHRFLSALPTIKDLSECDDDKLMKLWQGLGYYSRARNLKKSAIIIERDFCGELPADRKLLTSLPGIGDYTAGAISSISFHLGEPAVDGNVLRVYARLKEDDLNVLDLSSRKKVTEILRQDYPLGENSKLLTEGIMELGETLCIPNGEPRCYDCPVQKYCKAYQHKTTALYPVKAQKQARKRLQRTVLLLECKGEIALNKRKNKGLLAGLYEFPCIEKKMSIHDVEEWLISQNISFGKVVPVGEAKHIFTHLEWEMTGYYVDCSSKIKDFTYASREQIEKDIPIPTAYAYYKKILYQK